MGLGSLLGAAGVLLFDRFVSHDRARFAKHIGECISFFIGFIALQVALAAVARINSDDTPSITNPGSGSETQERVNRSSPVVKEQ
jgi:hypothetical protein